MSEIEDDEIIFGSLEDLEVVSMPSEEQTMDDDLDNFENLQKQIPSNTHSQAPIISDNVEVIDDYFRNFLVRNGLTQTLEIFQSEWYEKVCMNHKFECEGEFPDSFKKNESLMLELNKLNSKNESLQSEMTKVKGTYEGLRKERDYYKISFNRTQQEKQKILKDFDKVKKVHETFETKYNDLTKRYETCTSNNMLLKIENERMNNKNVTLQNQIQKLETKLNLMDDKSLVNVSAINMSTVNKKQKKTGSINTPFPGDIPNPFQYEEIDKFHLRESASLFKTFKGHELPISRISMHPRKPVIATASDDHTWKLWNVPEGKYLMGGTHKDWVSGIHFHPEGKCLATSSADNTVKIWDFSKNGQCVSTFKEHTQVVWNVAFHQQGDFMASCSMDQSIKLWDLNEGKCRHSMRGHVDSVNNVQFVPFSTQILSCSGDKTISLWDMRTSHCAHTLIGHNSSINDATSSLKGDLVVSCDTDGNVITWDLRMLKEIIRTQISKYDLNAVKIDDSGKVIVTASNDGIIRILDNDLNLRNKLEGHADGVLDLAFDYHNKMIISSGNDDTFRLWR